MADIARTTAQIQSDLADGGSPGNVTLQKVRNAFISGPQWDDSPNASGLGAPAILRGSISLANTSGITMGAGLSLGTRQANATTLQAAFDYAAAWDKFLEFNPPSSSSTPPTIEIDNAAGIVCNTSNYNKFGFRGAKGCFLIQCHQNAPGLVFGDTTGAVGIDNADIEGLGLDYLFSVSQAGQTSARLLYFGAVNRSHFGKLIVGTKTSDPYVSIEIGNSSGTAAFWSNTIEDSYVHGASESILKAWFGGSTGNTFKNIYFVNALSGTAQACANPVVMSPSGFNCDENVFDGCNWEWFVPGSTGATLMNINGVNATFISNHWEGNKIAGFEGRMFLLTNSAIQIIGGKSLNNVVNSGFASGTGANSPAWISAYNQARLNVVGHTITAPNLANATDLQFKLFQLASFAPQAWLNGTITADMHVEGYDGFLSLDPTMPRATYGDFHDISSYDYPKIFPSVKSTVIWNPATNFIVSGSAGREVDVMFDSPIGAGVTLVLGLNMMQGSDKGNTLARPNADQVRVIRTANCTGAFSITVKNATSGGTTIGTPLAATGTATYGLNSGAWAAI